MFNAERTIEVNNKYANFFAFCIKFFNNGTNSVCTAAHNDDYVFCIFCTIVVEQMIFATCHFGDFAHVFFYDFRERIVVIIYCFTSLEVDVRILSSTTDNRVVRVQTTLAERGNCIFVEEFCQFVIFHNFDFLDFVGSTETVEEVQEGNSTFDCGKMSNSGKVHNFLNTAFSKKCEASLASSHNVLVVTKDGQGASCQSTCRNVENCGQQFASHFIHVRNHQKQALGCGVSSSQRTGLQGTVNSTCSTCFGLHFQKFYGLTEDVFLTLGRPFVYNFRHGRRRSNGINCSNISKCVRDIRSSSVAVHSFHFYHVITLFRLNSLYKNNREMTSFIPSLYFTILVVLCKTLYSYT